MTPPVLLVVGSTGSVGRLVVARADADGFAVRALLRRWPPSRPFSPRVEPVKGDISDASTFGEQVRDVDAIVFTHGSDGGPKETEAVDYGGVRNVLLALNGREARIALMTSIGVTNRSSAYNQSTRAHDWKRRSERLVRASGLPYTIVRPGWFDRNGPDDHRLVLLQGDRRQTGTPADGVIARAQLAEVLVKSLSTRSALRKTFELVSERGPVQQDVDGLFASLEPDPPGTVDGVHDVANMPSNEEPESVVEDLSAVRLQRRRAQ